MTDSPTFEERAAAHLIGRATAADLDVLRADPIRWRAVLVRISGEANITISGLKEEVKRIRAIEAGAAQAEAMRRRVTETAPRVPEVYDFRSDRAR